MAWWDHEDLKSKKDKSDRYKVTFPEGYSIKEVRDAQRRLDKENQAKEPEIRKD